jgi:beta-phosphoglucomutase-like phosphatase (HAD superfamily)
VFEDTAVGMRAARAAGMSAYNVTTGEFVDALDGIAA